jgi:hypothetical protein
MKDGSRMGFHLIHQGEHMKHYSGFLMAFFILFLTAGSCNSTSNQLPALSISSSSSSIAPGGAAVSFKATLQNLSGEVSWTLSPTLGTLSSNTGLEISYTPPPILATQTDVTLTASLGSLSAKAVLTVKPGAQIITVTGKVLNYNGEPGAFLPVAVAGQKTATDAGGNFSVPGVTVPYDLAVLLESKTPAKPFAYIYQGVTRPDPVALIPGGENDLKRSETTYTFTGIDTSSPLPGEFRDSIIGCGSNDYISCGGVRGAVGQSPYTQTVGWRGPQNIEADVYALQTFNDVNGVATAFRGFALTKGVNFSNGQPTTVPLNFQPIGTGTVNGRVIPPSGYTLTYRALGFKPRGRTQYPYPFSSESNRRDGISQTFSWARPVDTDMELYLGGAAIKGEASVYADMDLDDAALNTANVSLILPAPPELAQPDFDASDITNSTMFSWTPFEEGVHTLSVTPTTAGSLDFTIYTAKTETTLPDLTILGYPLPRGVTYEWSVRGQAPVASIDDFMDNQGVFPPYPRNGYSGIRMFTTMRPR